MVDLLWVRADQRGRGIGSRLLAECERRLADRFDAAHLECFEPHVAVVEFYRRQSYCATTTYFDEAAGVNRIVMRKVLSATTRETDSRSAGLAS